MPEHQRNLFSIVAIKDPHENQCKQCDKKEYTTIRGEGYGEIFKIKFEVEVSLKSNVAESKRNILSFGLERLEHEIFYAVVNISNYICKT